MGKLFSKEEAQEIVSGDHDDFETIDKTIDDTSRWSIYYTGVFKEISTGKFYEVSWSEGATEMQDEAPFEYENEVNFVEVKPQEMVVIKYVKV